MSWMFSCSLMSLGISASLGQVDTCYAGSRRSMSSPACSIRATSFPVSSCHDKFVVDTCSLSPIGISNVGAFRSESFNVVVVFYCICRRQVHGVLRRRSQWYPFQGSAHSVRHSLRRSSLMHVTFTSFRLPMETLNSTGELAAVSHSGLNIVPGLRTANLYPHTVT